jgi:hypothetical protein
MDTIQNVVGGVGGLVDELAVAADLALGAHFGFDVGHGDHGFGVAREELVLVEVGDHEGAGGEVGEQGLVRGHEAAADDDVLEVLRVEQVRSVAVEGEGRGGGGREAQLLHLTQEVLGHRGVDGGEDAVAHLHAVRDADGVRPGQVHHLLRRQVLRRERGDQLRRRERRRRQVLPHLRRQRHPPVSPPRRHPPPLPLRQPHAVPRRKHQNIRTRHHPRTLPLHRLLRRINRLKPMHVRVARRRSLRPIPRHQHRRITTLNKSQNTINHHHHLSTSYSLHT